MRGLHRKRWKGGEEEGGGCFLPEMPTFVGKGPKNSGFVALRVNHLNGGEEVEEGVEEDGGSGLGWWGWWWESCVIIVFHIVFSVMMKCMKLLTGATPAAIIAFNLISFNLIESLPRFSDLNDAVIGW